MQTTACFRSHWASSTAADIARVACNRMHAGGTPEKVVLALAVKRAWWLEWPHRALLRASTSSSYLHARRPAGQHEQAAS